MSQSDSLQFIPSTSKGEKTEPSTHEKILLSIANATVRDPYKHPSFSQDFRLNVEIDSCGWPYYTTWRAIELLVIFVNPFPSPETCICPPIFIHFSLGSMYLGDGIESMDIFTMNHKSNPICKYLRHEVNFHFLHFGFYDNRIPLNVIANLKNLSRITALKLDHLYLTKGFPLKSPTGVPEMPVIPEMPGIFESITFYEIFNHLHTQLLELDTLIIENSIINLDLMKQILRFKKLKFLKIVCNKCNINIAGTLPESLETLILYGVIKVQSLPKFLKKFELHSDFFVMDGILQIPQSLIQLIIDVRKLKYLLQTRVKYERRNNVKYQTQTNSHNMIELPENSSLEEVTIHIYDEIFETHSLHEHSLDMYSHYGIKSILRIPLWIIRGPVLPELKTLALNVPSLHGIDNKNLFQALSSGKFPKLEGMFIWNHFPDYIPGIDIPVKLIGFDNADSEIVLSILNHPSLLHVQAPVRFLFPDEGKAVLQAIKDNRLGDNGAMLNDMYSIDEQRIMEILNKDHNRHVEFRGVLFLNNNMYEAIHP